MYPHIAPFSILAYDQTIKHHQHPTNTNLKYNVFVCAHQPNSTMITKSTND